MGPFLPRDEPPRNPCDGPGGVITPGMIHQALDEAWAKSATVRLRERSEPVHPFDEWKPFCGAELFPLPKTNAPVVLAEHWSAVFVMTGRDDGPIHGPSPAVCVLDAHPGSPWHCDGRGTWWK